MFRMTRPKTAMRHADDHRFDGLTFARKSPALGRTGIANVRIFGSTRRHRLARLVVLAGLALPCTWAQPIGALAQTAGAATAPKTLRSIATPPEGHTGIIVPPAGASPAPNGCPARAAADARSDATAHKTLRSIATPPEGHIGIIVPPAGPPRLRAPRS